MMRLRGAIMRLRAPPILRVIPFRTPSFAVLASATRTAARRTRLLHPVPTPTEAAVAILSVDLPSRPRTAESCRIESGTRSTATSSAAGIGTAASPWLPPLLSEATPRSPHAAAGDVVPRKARGLTLPSLVVREKPPRGAGGFAAVVAVSAAVRSPHAEAVRRKAASSLDMGAEWRDEALVASAERTRSGRPGEAQATRKAAQASVEAARKAQAKSQMAKAQKMGSQSRKAAPPPRKAAPPPRKAAPPPRKAAPPPRKAVPPPPAAADTRLTTAAAAET
ncbi:unnamed protein product [Closterium sp. Yama58-4]|nr:unnamed protein product [Closterium sp. Yama58-4]